MTLRALLSQICAVAILLVVAAMPSVAWAHGSHEHATEHAAIAWNTAHEGTRAQAFAGAGGTQDTALRQAASTLGTLDPLGIGCRGGACCCAGCTMALAEDIPQLAPLIFAGTRIPPPRSFGGPGTPPEALPKPPKSRV